MDTPIQRYGPQMVGLTPTRPLRLCTMYYGCDALRFIQPGDHPDAMEQQCMEIHIPRDHQPNGTPLHIHDFVEFSLMRSGVVDHLTPDGRRTLQRGDVLVILPGGIHAYHGYSQVCHTNIYLQPTWFLDELRLLWSERGLVRYLLADALFRMPQRQSVLLLETTEEETCAWEAEVRGIEKEAGKPNPSLAFFNGSFLKILSILNEAFLRDHHDAALPLRPEVWRAAEIIERIIDQAREFDPPAIAAEAGASAAYFARIFRHATGMSLTDYYQHRRVQRAMALLSQPGITVTDVAHRLGFADTAHFSRIFKRIAGITPSGFRRSHAA